MSAEAEFFNRHRPYRKLPEAVHLNRELALRRLRVSNCPACPTACPELVEGSRGVRDVGGLGFYSSNRICAGKPVHSKYCGVR